MSFDKVIDELDCVEYKETNEQPFLLLFEMDLFMRYQIGRDDTFLPKDEHTKDRDPLVG